MPFSAFRADACANLLEPRQLLQHFLTHPPEGFAPFLVDPATPGFVAPFDLLTTADAATLRVVGALPGSRWLRRLLTWPTYFLGTTVSEYLPVPHACEAAKVVSDTLAHWSGNSRLLILKDIPLDSPMLSAADNAAIHSLLDEAKARGFIMVEGQALAYVPIDFASADEYLSRLSPRRRKDIRRKLRVREQLQIEVLETGDARLFDQTFLDLLYALYVEVYAQSELHFDKLTHDFFAAVLQDATLAGKLFLYSRDGELIGFNLCFIHEGMLIDKYVGFRYPQARRANLYFVSWMVNLEYALTHGLSHYVAGWTDPEIKSYLGAKFTFTQHAVYIRNPVLRAVLKRLTKHFERDRAWFDEHGVDTAHP